MLETEEIDQHLRDRASSWQGPVYFEIGSVINGERDVAAGAREQYQVGGANGEMQVSNSYVGGTRMLHGFCLGDMQHWDGFADLGKAITTTLHSHACDAPPCVDTLGGCWISVEGRDHLTRIGLAFREEIKDLA